VTRLHAVAHANTINHCEYELGTRRMGVPFGTGRTFAVSFPRRRVSLPARSLSSSSVPDR